MANQNPLAMLPRRQRKDELKSMRGIVAGLIAAGMIWFAAIVLVLLVG